MQLAHNRRILRSAQIQSEQRIGAKEGDDVARVFHEPHRVKICSPCARLSDLPHDFQPI